MRSISASLNEVINTLHSYAQKQITRATQPLTKTCFLNPGHAFRSQAQSMRPQLKIDTASGGASVLSVSGGITTGHTLDGYPLVHGRTMKSRFRVLLIRKGSFTALTGWMTRHKQIAVQLDYPVIMTAATAMPAGTAKSVKTVQIVIESAADAAVSRAASSMTFRAISGLPDIPAASLAMEQRGKSLKISRPREPGDQRNENFCLSL